MTLNNNCGIFYTVVKSMAISDNLKRGTVELSVLTLLQKGDMYGYEISQQLFEQSGELYQIQESSLYPTLYRLVEKGLITDRSEKVGKRRVRVYYHLETAGEKYLKELKREYISHTAGVLRILGVKESRGLLMTSTDKLIKNI